MDRIIVNQVLSPKEKAKLAAKYKTWLQEQGELPDLEALKRQAKEAHERALILLDGLSHDEDYIAVANALSTYTALILNTLHGNKVTG